MSPPSVQGDPRGLKSSIQFRESTASDLDILTDWTMQLMQHEAIDEKLELPLKEDVRDRISNWLGTLIESDSALFIIAEDESKQPIGCVLGLLQLVPNDFIEVQVHGLIQMIWVDPTYRRKGVAEALLNHMESTYKNLDIPYCEISYSMTNLEAESFWQKHGYSPVSVTCRKFL